MTGPFTTKITHARLTWSPFSAESMLDIATVTLDSIQSRLSRAIDVKDSPAKALTEKYAKRKMKVNRAPVRDWELRGVTRRSLKVKSVSEDRATLGPTTREADTILSIRRKDDLWGVSPSDELAIRAAIRATLIKSKCVRVVRTKVA